MSTISQPTRTVSKARCLPADLLLRNMWAGLAIVVIWLAVLFDALFGPDIVSTGGTGTNSTTIPSAVAVGFLGTDPVHPQKPFTPHATAPVQPERTHRRSREPRGSDTADRSRASSGRVPELAHSNSERTLLDSRSLFVPSRSLTLASPDAAIGVQAGVDQRA
jgi:hypothetical protein